MNAILYLMVGGIQTQDLARWHLSRRVDALGRGTLRLRIERVLQTNGQKEFQVPTLGC